MSQTHGDHPVEAVPAPTGRDLWRRYELVHDVAYFHPAVLERASALGMKGFWMGYFAMRSAPFGAVDPAVVTATFHGFHPARVGRALPDAWAYTTPDRALAERLAGADDAVRNLAARAGTTDADLVEVADLLWAVGEAADTAGRPLAAANQALPRPDSVAARLWQATATVREHRGDGHIAVLVARRVSPAMAHHLKIAAGESAADALRSGRGFPDDAWQRGADDLRGRGWLDDDGRLTAAGRTAHDEIEAATDALAEQPWRTVGTEHTRRVLELLEPLAAAMARSGLMPFPNPVGLVLDEQVQAPGSR